MTPIRLLLADDHNLVRAGIRSLLAGIKDVQVVAEARTGREALQLIKAHQPDVVLMDIAMMELNGLEATAHVVREFAGVRVIILSMHSTEEYVLQALRAGAMGYLLKDAATSELELAVKSVARGETYLSPSVSKHVINEYARRVNGKTGKDETQLSRYEHLTPRQREVLQLIAEGHTTKEISQKLEVSVKTVDTHRSQLMKRMAIHDVAGLVRYAIRVGLVTPDQ
ncbi:MAG: response regulator transcription factor [Acidobacteria bacterium]|nr:response regulator transcription factor [Acidobacteriota bacterium]MCI0719232.1 response regulator transcription factor [Acidobacteriota bacterium]